MGFLESISEIVRALSGAVFVETNEAGVSLVQCPEIAPLLVIPVQGGETDPAEHFPEHPDSLVVWEDQWFHKPEVIRSRIAARFGHTKRIHARQCRVIALDKPVLQDFLEAHHMHVPAGAKTKLGLEWKDELVAVASFGKPCPVHRNGKVWKSVELIRFCNASGKTVVGGLSKLLRYYSRRYVPEDIMTYADLEWSTGGSYRRLGFEKAGSREAMEFWIQPVTLRRFYAYESAELLEASGLAAMDRAALLDMGWTCIRNRGSLKFILPLK